MAFLSTFLNMFVQSRIIFLGNAFLSKNTILSTSLSNITFLCVFLSTFLRAFPVERFLSALLSTFFSAFFVEHFFECFFEHYKHNSGTSEPYSRTWQNWWKSSSTVAKASSPKTSSLPSVRIDALQESVDFDQHQQPTFSVDAVSLWWASALRRPWWCPSSPTPRAAHQHWPSGPPRSTCRTWTTQVQTSLRWDWGGYELQTNYSRKAYSSIADPELLLLRVVGVIKLGSNSPKLPTSQLLSDSFLSSACYLAYFHSHLILSFAWSPSAVDEPSIGASSGRVSDSKVTLVTPLVEVVSIEVTVMDGIWADILALPKVILVVTLTNNHPL